MAKKTGWLTTTGTVTKHVAAKVQNWADGSKKCQNGCGGRVGCGVDGRFICTPCRRDYKVGSYQKNQHNQWAHPLGDPAIPHKQRRS